MALALISLRKGRRCGSQLGITIPVWRAARERCQSERLDVFFHTDSLRIGVEQKLDLSR
jgi:hypothetical protein